jgi:hypothetical protein
MTQPEALRLADYLQKHFDLFPNSEQIKAAAELIRLHEVNQELLAALNEVYITCDWHGDDGREAMSKAHAAIAKGEAK